MSKDLPEMPTKPPLGCIPKNLFYEMRLNDLKRAVNDYLELSKSKLNQYTLNLIKEWINEIQFIIENKLQVSDHDIKESELVFEEPDNNTTKTKLIFDEHDYDTIKTKLIDDKYNYEIFRNGDDEFFSIIKITDDGATIKTIIDRCSSEEEAIKSCQQHFDKLSVNGMDFCFQRNIVDKMVTMNVKKLTWVDFNDKYKSQVIGNMFCYSITPCISNGNVIYKINLNILTSNNVTCEILHIQNIKDLEHSKKACQIHFEKMVRHMINGATK